MRLGAAYWMIETKASLLELSEVFQFEKGLLINIKSEEVYSFDHHVFTMLDDVGRCFTFGFCQTFCYTSKTFLLFPSLINNV